MAFPQKIVCLFLCLLISSSLVVECMKHHGNNMELASILAAGLIAKLLREQHHHHGCHHHHSGRSQPPQGRIPYVTHQPPQPAPQYFPPQSYQYTNEAEATIVRNSAPQHHHYFNDAEALRNPAPQYTQAQYINDAEASQMRNSALRHHHYTDDAEASQQHVRKVKPELILPQTQSKYYPEASKDYPKIVEPAYRKREA